MELKQTAELMLSPDYKERFRAEYHQLKIRTEKLQAMVEAWDNGTLKFTPTCPRTTYDLQLDYMKKYLAVLDMRAVIEQINL